MALVMCLSLVQVTAFAEENVYIADDMVQNEIVPCTHEWSQWVETQAATCTETGVKTLACALCSTLITDVVETEDLAALEKTGEIPASGHSYVDGVCERCGAEDPDHPKACVHSWGEWAVTKPATEEETGEEARICSVCGDVETQTTGKLEPQPPVEEPVPPEVQAFLDAVYALYDASEEQMLQAVEYAGMLYNALTGEQKALEEVYQCKYALDAFRETMTLEEPEEDTVNDENSLKEAVIKGGSVKLGDNITLTSTLEISNTVTLDLNGKTLALVSSNATPVIRVNHEEANFTLADNSAEKTGMVTGGKNGGVRANHGIFTMTGGTISGNTAGLGGGVFVGAWDGKPADATFIMNGGTISNNGANEMGGAFFVESGCTLVINKGTISDNFAGSSGKHNDQTKGGGIVTCGTVILGSGAVVSSNGKAGRIGNITYDVVQYGGGVAISDDGTLTVSAGAQIINNQAKWGGGVTIGECGKDNPKDRGTRSADNQGLKFTMTGGIISGNIAEEGGGVRVDWCYIPGLFEMSGGEISGNTATVGGGVYVDTNSVATMSGGEISKNTATTGTGVDVDCNGGGVYVCKGSTFTMSGDAAISENTAVMRGGGVCNKGTFTMTGGKIQKNQSTNTGNKGTADGAGIFTSGTFEMNGPSLIDANYSERGYGGGVYVLYAASGSCTCTITGGTISNNSSLCGGGIYVDTPDDVAMTNATIIGNTARDGGWGGGIYVWRCGKLSTMTDMLISNNVAGTGGGVAINIGYGRLSGRPTLGSGVQVIDNAAKDAGGGIVVRICNEKSREPVVIDGCTISGNVAGAKSDRDYSGDGGGIVTYAGTWLKIKNTQITKNGTAKMIGDVEYSPVVYGGGIDMEDSTCVEVESVTITGNEAYCGGGVSIGDCSIDSPESGMTSGKDTGEMVFTMKGGTISNNKAAYGGGVNIDHCATAGTFIMSDGAIITNNTAERSGGGVYGERASLFEMSDGVLNNNRAGYQGDDIYSDATGTIHIMDISQKGWELDGKDNRCTHDITGWFVDSAVRRWNSTDDLETAFTTYTEVTGEQALKAAHNFVKVNVTANYTYTLDGVPQSGSRTVSEVNKAPVHPDGTVGLDTVDFRTFTLNGTQRTFNLTGATVNGSAGNTANGELTWTISEGNIYTIVLNYNLAETTPPPAIPSFSTPGYSGGSGAPGGSTGGTTITDEEVPLAGAVGLNDTDHFAYVIGYDDDTVRPLNNITRAEAATIFFRLMTDEYRAANWSTTNSFSDVNAGDWYNNAVSTCANAGVLKGYEDGTFRPKAPITRAEFAAMAAGFMDESITDEGTGDFSDTADHWAAAAIRRAAKAGWVTGSGNKFNPNEKITRAEVMTIVNRMLDRTPDKDHMLPTMKKWTDNPEDAWYYEAVQEATNEHDYERDELSIETWTELLTERDWKALETEWANNGGASAPKADDTEAAQRMNQVPDGI